MPTFYQRFQESARKFPENIALEIQRHKQWSASLSRN